MHFAICKRMSGLMVLLLLGACASDGAAPSDPASDGSAGTAPGAGGSTLVGGAGTSGSAAVSGASGTPGTTAPGATAGSGGVAAAGAGSSIAGIGGSLAGGAGGVGGMDAAGSSGMGGMGSAGTSATPEMSAGCGKAPPASDTSIMVSGMTGSYILDLPTDYDNTKAYPLVFVWHGAGVTNTAFHGYLDMHAVVGNDAILVTPECLNDSGSWGTDMAYPDALIEHFETNYCIDESRLFTTGHSMGGMYTGQIGCQRGDVFRGDAVLAAPHPGGQCVDGNMAAMMSVGDSDFVANGPTEFAWWAAKNGCDASMTMPVDPMQCVEYGGCDPDKPVRTCTFSGGHEIPGWVAGAVWGFFKGL
jgi:poly(3-hydroxybutyrate) depolymerase